MSDLARAFIGFAVFVGLLLIGFGLGFLLPAWALAALLFVAIAAVFFIVCYMAAQAGLF